MPYDIIVSMRFEINRGSAAMHRKELFASRHHYFNYTCIAVLVISRLSGSAPGVPEPVTASATWVRLLANTMRKWPMRNESRRTREATGKLIFGCGGYLRWQIGLAFWQDGMDRG